MTKDREWGEPLTGPEVKALGLPGDTPVSADDMPLRLRDWALLSDTPFYQLPDDHPAYIVLRYNKVHGTNFVYWAGGDEAPDDWFVSGPVLNKGGSLCPAQRCWDWTHMDDASDIIGYTKKPQLVTEEASERLSASIEQLDAFTPCERTVRMCIEAVKEKEHLLSSVRAVEALLPKPDRAEELVEEYRRTFTNYEVVAQYMDDELAFARWLIERGEIKG